MKKKPLTPEQEQEKMLKRFLSIFYKQLSYTVGVGKLKKNKTKGIFKQEDPEARKAEISETERALIIRFFHDAHHLLAYRALSDILQFGPSKDSFRMARANAMLDRLIDQFILLQSLRPTGLVDYLIDLGLSWQITILSFYSGVLSMAFSDQVRSHTPKGLERQFPWKPISDIALLLSIHTRAEENLNEEATVRFINEQFAAMFEKCLPAKKVKNNKTATKKKKKS